LYIFEYTELEWDERFKDLSIDEIDYLNDLAMEVKHTYLTLGSVGDEEDPISDDDKKLEAKEDLRELIFKTRKDGKELKGIKRESDLKFRL